MMDDNSKSKEGVVIEDVESMTKQQLVRHKQNFVHQCQ